MAIDRSLLARSAVQGAWWAFLWRVFVFAALAEAPFLIARTYAPDTAVFAFIARLVVGVWLFVRIILPTWILLRRHYWRVFDLAVSADPSLAKAIVTDQWAYLRRDLTLPWRAIRG
jgi:hypothetical protein